MTAKTANSVKSKSDKIFHIASCVLALEVSKGHLGWTVSGLVKKSGLSRTLVYRYFGGSKLAILENSVDRFVEIFYGLHHQEQPQPFWTSVKAARKHIQKFPEAAVFYQKCRSLDSALKNRFIIVERKFQKKLKRQLSLKTDAEVLVVHSIIHGLVTAPFLDIEDVQAIIQYLKVSKLEWCTVNGGANSPQ